MFYLALLLLLVGLLVFFVALFSERASAYQSESELEPHQKEYKVYTEPEEIDIIFPEIKEEFTAPDEKYEEEEDIFISFSDEPPVNRFDEEFTEPDEEFLPAAISEEELIPDSGPLNHELLDSSDIHHEKKIYAALYDDRTGNIDYRKLKNVVAPLDGLYKNMKRIGKGHLLLDEDGLSFYMDGRLYRIDFHKIEDLFAGDDYIALPLKGSDSVKLFLLEGNSDFPSQAFKNFQEYLKAQ